MGLFDIFKKSDSGLPKELENLLNMVLENGEITDDEMAVLRAKAEKFDISEGELNIIIKNRLLKSQPTAKEEKVQISLDEVNEKISANLYDANDSYPRLVEKYNALLDLSAMPLDSNLKTKVHNAKLVFINSIVMPETKEGVIDLLSHTVPYSKTTLGGDVLKTLSSVGTFAAKSLMGSVGVVSSIATLGKSKEVVNKATGVVTKAMTTNEMDEIDAWKKKLLQIVSDAKKTLGGTLFNKDADFDKKLDALAKEIKG
jgi:hypothetical protein